MNTNRLLLILASLCSLLLLDYQTFAQGTIFTYQGRLNDGGIPANGTNYGMVFYLYDAPTNGTLLGSLGVASMTVSNGLFTTPLDFGNVFDGNPRWLEISVQKNGSGFATLTPRQSISTVPYASFANTASNLTGTVPASQVVGAPKTYRYSSFPLLYCNGGGITAAYNGGTLPLSVSLYYSTDGSHWLSANGNTNFPMTISTDRNSIAVTNQSQLCVYLAVNVLY